jgi:hypothetical protein
MKEIIIKFLSNSKGELSSKRLGFITSLINAIVISWAVIVGLFLKHEYALILEIVNGIWFATFGFAGVVASEIFKKDKEPDNV